MEKIILVVAVLVLMIGAPIVYAETAYQSGFKHGVADGRQSDTTKWYILQPNNGFANHTKQFDRGYVAGWCSVNSVFSGSDADQASFNCREGPDSASWLISGTSGKELPFSSIQ
jgi:hypothetical protein